MNILLVEDDPDDLFLARRALDRSGLTYHLDHAEDGLKALEHLNRGPRPDVVLMDINMPRMDGLEALRAIRADPAHAGLPVVMLTTSDSERDILAAFDHQATAYYAKPLRGPELAKVVLAVAGAA
ncbi:MAG: response regulator [Candidatus Thermoplasmatota archaeon]